MLQSNLIFVLYLTSGVAFVTQTVISLQTENKQAESDHAGSKSAADAVEDERRATWLETRNLKENFEQLTLLSLKDLINKGHVNPEVVFNKEENKRGRHQGFCFKKTKSGRFLPYICWKDGEQDE